MNFDDVVAGRKSSRKFKSKRPDWRLIIEAINSGLQAPLAGNLPSVKFILVDDIKKISKLAEECDQDFISEAKYVVVVCSDPTEVVRSYYERGERYYRQQAGAAIENFLLKLVDVGLSGCWVGSFVDDNVKRLLRIPEGLEVEAVIPVGYDFDKAKGKRKPSLDRSLSFNKYGQRFMKPRTGEYSV